MRSGWSPALSTEGRLGGGFPCAIRALVMCPSASGFPNSLDLFLLHFLVLRTADHVSCVFTNWPKVLMSLSQLRESGACRQTPLGPTLALAECPLGRRLGPLLLPPGARGAFSGAPIPDSRPAGFLAALQTHQAHSDPRAFACAGSRPWKAPPRDVHGPLSPCLFLRLCSVSKAM